jgi:hypothetical protein
MLSDDDMVDGLLRLMAERDRLEIEVAALRKKLAAVPAEADVVRKAYRRGYMAGRESQRRGAEAVTNPERTSRGWLRQAILAPEVGRLHKQDMSAGAIATQLGVSRELVCRLLDASSC